jgi:hypothetical protein
MLIADFNTNFNEYINDGDIIGANDAIMVELGDILVNNKQNFIDLLNESDIEADISMSNNQLIGLYIDNVDNKHLLLGTSLLVNMQKIVECEDCSWSWKLIDGGDDPKTCHKCGSNNSTSNFDDSNNISDEDVKNAYVVLNENFNDDEYFSEVFGSKIFKQGTKALRNLKSEGTTSNSLKLRAEVKIQQATITQQKAQLKEQKIALEKSKKTKNTIIIVSATILVLTIGIVLFLKRK